jgi:hypothetical protein
VCIEVDICAAGVGGDALECDDDDLCTQDSCSATEGCPDTPVDTPCEDGDACTVSDHCDEGVWVGGPPLVCDDLEPCTVDGRDPGSGCTVTVVGEGEIYQGVCWLLLAATVDDEQDCASRCAGVGMTCTQENLNLIDTCSELKSLASMLSVGIDVCYDGYGLGGAPMVSNGSGSNPQSGASNNLGYDPNVDTFGGGWCHQTRPVPRGCISSRGRLDGSTSAEVTETVGAVQRQGRALLRGARFGWRQRHSGPLPGSGHGRLSGSKAPR